MRAKATYTAFQTFFNLLLWVPIFYEFQKRIGLSDPEIFAIQSLYYVAFCLLEIPTGFLADRFGYRATLVAGGVTLTAANLLPPLFPGYDGMLYHFILIALARSLVSGAGSAWLYEYLRERGETADYKKIEGDARFWSLVARVGGWAAVGHLMAAGLYLPYWLSAVNAGLALAAACLLPRAAPVLEQGKRLATFANIGLAWTVLRRTPQALVIMAQGIALFVMVRILQVNLYQPILSDKGFDLATFGWIMAGMTVAEAAGSRAVRAVRGRVTDHGVVVASNLVLAAGVGVIAAGSQLWTLIAFGFFSFAAGLMFPVQKQLLNDAIPDGRVRATVLSVESILDRAVCAVAVLPLGALVAAGKLDQILYVGAAVTAVLTLAVRAIGARLQAKAAPAAEPYRSQAS